jgi:hypothetical protein
VAHSTDAEILISIGDSKQALLDLYDIGYTPKKVPDMEY